MKTVSSSSLAQLAGGFFFANNIYNYGSMTIIYHRYR
ncbi:hypothetical protein PMI40_01541 [Herbaspirillum sp. YR522]|nr:hypothetical protein PMI40_01541 [Herbaspirillum sp. YR522]